MAVTIPPNIPDIDFAINDEFNQAHYSTMIGKVYRPFDARPAYIKIANLPKTLWRALNLIMENKETPLSERVEEGLMIRILTDDLNLTQHLAQELLTRASFIKPDDIQAQNDLVSLFSLKDKV
jgi:hypothetical protein